MILNISKRWYKMIWCFLQQGYSGHGQPSENQIWLQRNVRLDNIFILAYAAPTCGKISLETIPFFHSTRWKSQDKGLAQCNFILTWTSFHTWTAFDFINESVLTCIIASKITYFATFGTVQKSEWSGIFAFEIVLLKLWKQFDPFPLRKWVF